MADLTRDDVAKVAHLARLTLSEVELELFTGQLAKVLEHAADIEGLDLGDVAPTAHPAGLVNVVRPDEPGPCLAREAVLEMAPDARDARFAVPRIVGEAP